MNNAEEILGLIHYDLFNTTRPSGYILEDLIEVIRFLDEERQKQNEVIKSLKEEIAGCEDLEDRVTKLEDINHWTEMENTGL